MTSAKRLSRHDRRRVLLNCLYHHEQGITFTQLRHYAEEGRLPYSGTFRTLRHDLNRLRYWGFVRATGHTNQRRYHFVPLSAPSPVQSACTQPHTDLASDVSLAPLGIRDCFGNGRLVAIQDGYGIDATGLHKPLALTFADSTPDLSSCCGQVITYNGLLPLAKGDLEELSIQAENLTIADDTVISKVWCAVAGNLDDAPELNPQDNCFDAVIFYANNSKLRLSAYPYFSCTGKFKELEAGQRVTVYGALESYSYYGCDYLKLSVQGFYLL